MHHESVEELKAKADQLILDANCNIIVFVDDIDRLDVNEVQSLFRLVKLLGDFPRTTYILSFDDDLVAASLGPRYANGDKSSGYEFLEKIIQLPLHLPKANEQALRKYTLELIDNVLNYLNFHLSEKEIEDFILKFDEAFLPAIDNPRLGVRFANSIGFSIPLLMGEVNISDLMAIEGIKTFYPELYHFIRNNQAYFLKKYSGHNGYMHHSENEKREIKHKLNEVLHSYDNKLKLHIVDMLMSLFPQLKTVYENFGFPNRVYEQWYRERRICSPHYFERYFSYVVSEGDISDIYFTELLANLDTVSKEELLFRFTHALDKIKADVFLFKLNKFIPAFTQDQCMVIAKVLAQMGTCFSYIQQSFLFGTKDQAGYLIFSLLKKIPQEQRLEMCMEVLQVSQPFDFTMVIQNKFRFKKHHEAEEDFLSERELVTVCSYLIKRFEKEKEIGDMFTMLTDHVLRSILLMYVETGKQPVVKKMLMDLLRIDVANALSIIRTFTTSIRNNRKDYSYKSGFDEDSYRDLNMVIDLDQLYFATLTAFGSLQYDASENQSSEDVSNANIIAKFQQMHLHKNNITHPPFVKEEGIILLRNKC